MNKIKSSRLTICDVEQDFPLMLWEKRVSIEDDTERKIGP